MSAVPSAIPESKAAEQRAHEPSMEEILASIRRIIADDQALPLSPRPSRDERPAPSASMQPDLRALMGDDRMRPPPVSRPSVDLSGSFISPPPRTFRDAAPPPVSAAPSLRPSAPVADVHPFTSQRSPLPAPRLVETTPEPVEERLVSDETDQAVASSFQQLNATRVVLPTAEAVDAMTREMLRPMLKQWLDDNLPTLVERLVRAEIERVARGSR